MSYVKYNPTELQNLIMKSYSEFDKYIRNHRNFKPKSFSMKDRILYGGLINFKFLFEEKPLKDYFYQNDQYYRAYQTFQYLITSVNHCVGNDIDVHLDLEDLDFILRWREKL